MVEGFEKQDAYMDVVYQKLPSVLSENELKMVRLSREAYEADELLYKCSRSRDTSVLNGKIVTDSESDDPFGDTQLHSEEFQAVIDKKAAAHQKADSKEKSKDDCSAALLGKKKV